MKFTDLFDESKLSRRKLLQSMGTIAAVATVSGCSSDGDDDNSVAGGGGSSLVPNENLVMDKTLTQYWSTGPHNCGAKCVHKVHVKNGRILKFTSCGDVLRAEDNSSESVGENGIPIQRRACVRGYAYVQRLYQPDKLKYPLIQMGTRGDVNGFKRVTWNKATSDAAAAIKAAVARKATLGYTPIMTYGGAVFPYLSSPAAAPAINVFLGNESTGGADAVKFDAVGPDAVTNNVADRLNSKFIITWGLDPSRTTYHVANSHWYNTKAKEKGIPTVCITTNYNDTAAILTSGVPNYTYSINNVSKTVSIPGWIPCRPATDGALAVAMAYVIYKNNLQDPAYVGTRANPSNAKSFGFFPADTVVSTAPGGDLVEGSAHRHTSVVSAHTKGHKKNLKSPHAFVDADGKAYERGDSYKGAKFTVPAGESFSEYLDSREIEWGGAVTAGSATAGDATYYAVLDYVEHLTGVNANVIEALAHKYATAGDGTYGALLDVGGGPQRAWNGPEWNWLMIALCAMTGNIDKPGGGAGYAMMSNSDAAVLALNPALTGGANMAILGPAGMLSDSDTINAIYVSENEYAHLALTGTDHRTRQQMIDDVKITTLGKVDLSGVPANNKLIEVDVYMTGGASSNHLTTNENINKNIEAFKAIPTVICREQVMTPTALYSTILFPVASHYEFATTDIQVASAVIFARDKAIDKMYETKTDNEIIKGIVEVLNVDIKPEYDTSGLVNAEKLTEASLGAFAVNQVYKDVVGNQDAAFSFDDLMKQGFTEAIIPPDKPLVAFRDFPHCKPGNLENTTGKINFYSPLWGQIRPKRAYAAPAGTRDAAGNDVGGTTIYNGFRHATVQYQPHIEGYEKFFENNDPRQAFTGYKSPLSNRTYGLYYMTNKARNRAHTVFDNVGMIKDQFEQNVKIHPTDAATRGIKNGDMVYAYNDRGCTKIPAHVTQEIPPGVISIEHGAWYRAHPTEKVKVWLQLSADGQHVEKTVPVDVGGAENILTLDLGTTEQYVGQATNAQGGPCEVSLTKPE